MIEYDQEKKLIITQDEIQKSIPNNCCLNKIVFENLTEYAAKGNIFQIDMSTGEEDSAKDFRTRCIRMASFMRDAGLKENDVVSTCTDNHLNTFVPILAAQFIGCLPASTDTSQSFEETKRLVSLVKPKLFFVAKGSVEIVMRCIRTLEIQCKVVSFEASDDCLSFSEIMTQYKDVKEEEFVPIWTGDFKNDRKNFIFFSSGTTGLSKPVPQTNEPQHVGEYVLCDTSPFWSPSYFKLSIACINGFTILLMNGFDPKTYWDVVRKYKLIFVTLASTKTAEGLPYLTEPLPDLKFFQIMGGQMPIELKLQLIKKLPNCEVLNGYGATEIGMVTQGANNDKPKSLGTPIHNGQIIKVVNPETEEVLGFNEIGEIRVKSSYQFNGYYNMDSRDYWDSEGFYKTGDLGYYDDDFEFFVVDRIKDIFKYRSWHISPLVIENALCAHKDVVFAIVFSVPHGLDGDHAMAAVVVKDNASVTEEQLLAFANDRLEEKYKIRAGVRIIAKNIIPFTASGKVKKNLLRDLLTSTPKTE